MGHFDEGRVDRSGGVDFLAWRICPGRTVEIVDVQVGSARRRGVGRSMVDEAIQQVGELVGPGVLMCMYAVTRASNEIAQQFYEGVGFHVAGRLHRFYPGADRSLGESALVYAKEFRT